MKDLPRLAARLQETLWRAVILQENMKPQEALAQLNHAMEIISALETQVIEAESLCERQNV